MQYRCIWGRQVHIFIFAKGVTVGARKKMGEWGGQGKISNPPLPSAPTLYQSSIQLQSKMAASTAQYFQNNA